MPAITRFIEAVGRGDAVASEELLPHVKAELSGLDPRSRAAYLAQACGENTPLRDRVEAFLLAHDAANAFTAAPVSNETLEPFEPVREKAGSKIGRYKLLEQIGEGGFGAIFMAEQDYPVRRRVALKILKLGMDTRQVVARFEAERQALAMMDHPNIAKVLDGGATESGRPYFVMELVRGIAITEACDKSRMDVRHRLGLFSQVCQAVQHAHLKGIIHRDLKPSNVLVNTQDDEPMVKVIDFGIAKATQSPLTDKTLFTQFNQMVGTPAYMSPEQAEGGLDIDTRTDIYSLGVLLYELLTGSTPFGTGLRAQPFAEMQRIIRDVEPTPPSTRLGTLKEALATLAQQRNTEPRKLTTSLRGELDWIVLRCLEKDRKRRYQTAGSLNDDIQRYLRDEPVEARPATRGYRMKKFVHRNRRSVVAAGAVLLALVLGLAIATVGFFRARAERNRAEAATALAASNYGQARAAVEDLLKVSDEKLYDQPGMQPLRLEMMKAVIDRYKPLLAQPIADPAPRAELARLYVRYGFLMLYSLHDDQARFRPVLDVYEKARAIQEELVKAHPNDRALRLDLGWTLIMEIWPNPGFWETVPPESERAWPEAMTLLKKLIEEDPKDPFARDDYATLIWRYSFFNHDSATMALTRQEADIREQLVREYPNSAEFRRDLTNTLVVNANLAENFSTDEKTLRANLTVMDRVLAIRQSILHDLEENVSAARLPARPAESETRMIYPSVMYTKRDLALAYSETASIHYLLKEWKGEIESLNQAIAIYEDLVEQNPSMDTFNSELDTAFQARCRAARREGDLVGNKAFALDAAIFWEKEAAQHPEFPALAQLGQDARRLASTQPASTQQ